MPLSLPQTQPRCCHVRDGRQQPWVQQGRVEHAHSAGILAVAILTAST